MRREPVAGTPLPRPRRLEVDAMKPAVLLVLVVFGALLLATHTSSAQVPADVPRFKIAYATFVGGEEPGAGYEEA